MLGSPPLASFLERARVKVNISESMRKARRSVFIQVYLSMDRLGSLLLP